MHVANLLIISMAGDFVRVRFEIHLKIVLPKQA